MGLFQHIAGLFYGDIEIHRLDLSLLTPPEIYRLPKSVKTFALKPELEINASRITDFDKNFACSVKSIEFHEDPINVRKAKIKQYTRSDVKIIRVPTRKSIPVRRALKRVQALPQERRNMIKFQKNKPPVLKNEMLIAWYWPIVDGAVLKLALNKQRGTLLVWYNPRSRQFKARGVYLIRRLGLGEKPEWRWV